MSPVYFSALLLASLALSVAFTGVVLSYARKRNLIDHPLARSSHQVPTPRGGGLAIVVVFGLSLPFTLKTGFAPLLIGAMLVAGIGFWDDHRHIPARWRLLVHVGASLTFLGGTVYSSGFLSNWWNLAATWPQSLMLIIAVPALTWMINLYNFMDGIDGLAGVEAITVSAAAGLFLWMDGHNGPAQACLILAAASAGFLIWNRPPARIFMGDVGSGFLGFILGALAVVSTGYGLKWPAVWGILLSVFLVDATVTLVIRMINGEIWYNAHRTHAYQHAALRFGHRRVSLIVATINIGWLTPLAALVYWRLDLAPVALTAAFLPLFVLALRLGAGRNDDPDGPMRF